MGVKKSLFIEKEVIKEANQYLKMVEDWENEATLFDFDDIMVEFAMK